MHTHDAAFRSDDDAPLFLVHDRIAIEFAQVVLWRVVARIGKKVFQLGWVITLHAARNNYPQGIWCLLDRELKAALLRGTMA